MQQEDQQLTKAQVARKKMFEKYYQKQVDKRNEEKQKRVEFKLQTKDPKELQLYIQNEFRQKYETIMNPINQKIIKTEEEIDNLILEFKGLYQYYVDINYAMISYDKQVYKEQLDQLECTLYNLRRVIVPREKFRFSKPFPKAENKQQSEDKIMSHVHEQFMSDSIIIKTDNYQPEITLSEGSLVLQKLQNCTFKVNGTIDTLYLHSLENVQVEMGDVKGSVWVDKCLDCDFSGKTHQLRIHDTLSTQFTIYVSSNPIIENCKELKFGKLNDQEGNKWNQVQDFNWLKQEKSPHFILIE